VPPELSIVLPTHNESAVIERVVEGVADTACRLVGAGKWEVIVVGRRVDRLGARMRKVDRRNNPCRLADTMNAGSHPLHIVMALQYYRPHRTGLTLHVQNLAE
jgi:glycosyltransferase involved in cell wall biosynthesis